MDTDTILLNTYDAHRSGGRGQKLLVVLRVHRGHLISGHQSFNSGVAVNQWGVHRTPGSDPNSICYLNYAHRRVSCWR